MSQLVQALRAGQGHGHRMEFPAERNIARSSKRPATIELDRRQQGGRDAQQDTGGLEPAGEQAAGTGRQPRQPRLGSNTATRIASRSAKTSTAHGAGCEMVLRLAAVPGSRRSPGPIDTGGRRRPGSVAAAIARRKSFGKGRWIWPRLDCPSSSARSPVLPAELEERKATGSLKPSRSCGPTRRDRRHIPPPPQGQRPLDRRRVSIGCSRHGRCPANSGDPARRDFVGASPACTTRVLPGVSWPAGRDTTTYLP